MNDSFSKFETAKKLWETLFKQYATEDTGTTKNEIENFLNLQIEEGKSIITQVRDFQNVM